MHTRTWHVTINLFEREGLTRAEAILRTDAGPELRHEAVARLHPGDRDVPEIGDELATARALSELSHRLVEVASETISRREQRSVHLTG
jgi:hypothetical protein